MLFPKIVLNMGYEVKPLLNMLLPVDDIARGMRGILRDASVPDEVTKVHEVLELICSGLSLPLDTEAFKIECADVSENMVSEIHDIIFADNLEIDDIHAAYAILDCFVENIMETFENYGLMDYMVYSGILCAQLDYDDEDGVMACTVFELDTNP